MKKNLHVGLIGCGFTAKAHAYAFRSAAKIFDLPYQPVLNAVCGRDPSRLAKFADNWEFESRCTDWRQLIDDPGIHVIDIACPNDLHCEIAVAAAKAGKMVLCEKPLARNGYEAAQMVLAVEESGVPNMVWYNCRRIPAVALAKELIDEGRLGKIFHYRAKFLQDWTISEDLPQGGPLWRLDGKVAGSGVTGDLLAHCIDTALWLNGAIDKVTAITETFVRQRIHTSTGELEDVTIEDACAFLGRFTNGSLATFESTRYARGHKSACTFEINGEHASLAWDLSDAHRLEYFDHRDACITQGWRSIHATVSEHPYMDHWWVPGLQIGYAETFIHQIADFLSGLAAKKPASPTFKEAFETQLICDAVLKSGKTGQWERIVRPTTPTHLRPLNGKPCDVDTGRLTLTAS